MAILLKIDIEGDQQVAQALQHIPSDMDDLRKPFTKAGNFIIQEVDKNFASRGSRFGFPWPPRSPEYERRATWPIMEKSGKMRRGFRKKVGKSMLSIYNRQEEAYFKYHQSRKKPRPKIPRRVMLFLSMSIQRRVIREIQLAAVDILQQRGFRIR